MYLLEGHGTDFLELRKGEVHGIVKVCIAPPRSARAPDEGMPISSGIVRLGGGRDRERA